MSGVEEAAAVVGTGVAVEAAGAVAADVIATTAAEGLVAGVESIPGAIATEASAAEGTIGTTLGRIGTWLTESTAGKIFTSIGPTVGSLLAGSVIFPRVGEDYQQVTQSQQNLADKAQTDILFTNKNLEKLRQDLMPSNNRVPGKSSTLPQHLQ